MGSVIQGLGSTRRGEGGAPVSGSVRSSSVGRGYAGPAVAACGRSVAMLRGSVCESAAVSLQSLRISLQGPRSGGPAEWGLAVLRRSLCESAAALALVGRIPLRAWGMEPDVAPQDHCQHFRPVDYWRIYAHERANMAESDSQFCGTALVRSVTHAKAPGCRPEGDLV